MRRLQFVAVLIPLVSVALWPTTAAAFFHQWRFTEFFSNADGSVQFIELHSPLSGENQAAGAEIRSASTGKVLALTQNLIGSTANKTLLLATPGFHNLAGAVQPDFPLTPLPTNFFNPAGDTISLFHHQPIDSRTFTSVPTDGEMSRVFPSNTLEINSPTNFVGNMGSIDVSLLAGDYNDNGTVDAADYVLWRDNLGAIVTLPNDTTPEWVMDEDYPVWRANFGGVAGAAASVGAGSSVPEPDALVVWIGAMTLLSMLHSRRDEAQRTTIRNR